MKLQKCLVLVTLALPGMLMAQDGGNYECSHGDLQRRVEIVYGAGGSMPCEVHYHKDSEAPGEDQVLWRADNETGFCEARTSEFIARLEGWGWNCGKAAVAPEPAGEPVEPDDTEALVPADDAES